MSHLSGPKPLDCHLLGASNTLGEEKSPGREEGCHKPRGTGGHQNLKEEKRSLPGALPRVQPRQQPAPRLWASASAGTMRFWCSMSKQLSCSPHSAEPQCSVDSSRPATARRASRGIPGRAGKVLRFLLNALWLVIWVFSVPPSYLCLLCLFQLRGHLLSQRGKGCSSSAFSLCLSI